MGAPQSDVRQRTAPDLWVGAGHVLAVVLLPALVFVLYWAGLDGPMVFDDYPAVYYNVGLIDLWPPWKFLLTARPLTELSLALNVAQSGFTPRSFHVTNVVLHALTALLVYALAFRTLGLTTARLAAPRVRAAVALVTAALFAAHPLQTEVVAYISSRSEALAGLFYVLAVLLFAVAVSTPRPRLRLACTMGIPLVAAAGMASKEIAATIPAALLLYDWCFFAGRQQPRARLHWGLVALAALPLGLGVAALLSGVVSRGAEVTAGFGFDRFTPWQYVGTQFGVILQYVRLIVAPVGLTLDYDWPVARSPWTSAVLVPLAILVAALALVLWRAHRWPLLTFAVLWMLLVLAPTSSVMPIADLIAERRMYVALVGPLLALAAGVWVGLDVLRSRVTTAQWLQAVTYGAVAVLAVGVLARVTVARVQQWADPTALYQDTVDKAPSNPRAWLNLGATHVAQGRYDQGLPPLQEAERLYARGESVHAFDRVGAYIYYNLGVVAYQQRRYAEAAEYLNRSRALGPEYMGLLPMTSLYLGHLAMLARDWPAAIAHFEEALKYGGIEIRGLILPYLARAHGRLGQYEQARQRLAEVLREDPNNQQAHRVMQELGVKP